MGGGWEKEERATGREQEGGREGSTREWDGGGGGCKASGVDLCLGCGAVTRESAEVGGGAVL